jgi:hypothetical protein
MDGERSQFLTSMVSILDKLQETCVTRGEPLLASVLTIAKGEAEDALRHATELEEINALRVSMSSTTTWRAEDQKRVAQETAEVTNALAAAMDAAQRNEIAA